MACRLPYVAVLSKVVASLLKWFAFQFRSLLLRLRLVHKTTQTPAAAVVAAAGRQHGQCRRQQRLLLLLLILGRGGGGCEARQLKGDAAHLC